MAKYLLMFLLLCGVSPVFAQPVAENPCRYEGVLAVDGRCYYATPPPAELARVVLSPGQTVDINRQCVPGKRETWWALYEEELCSWAQSVTTETNGEIILGPSGEVSTQRIILGRLFALVGIGLMFGGLLLRGDAFAVATLLAALLAALAVAFLAATLAAFAVACLAAFLAVATFEPRNSSRTFFWLGGTYVILMTISYFLG